jgi:hypothetical protein
MPLVADPRTGRAEEQPIRRHTVSKAWFDLGRYARVVLAAQDSCRFVLGFTLCGITQGLDVEGEKAGCLTPVKDTNLRTSSR